MIEVAVNKESTISVSKKKDQIFLGEKVFDGEIVKMSKTSFKVYKPTKIFHVEVVSRNGKEMELKIDEKSVFVSITDHIDQILDKLGMNVSANAALKEIKAPMPGSILNILVKEGDVVSEGDQLLVLEAMKMENVIKSPGEGTVSKVHITEKENVEKNQILISFE